MTIIPDLLCPTYAAIYLPWYKKIWFKITGQEVPISRVFYKLGKNIICSYENAAILEAAMKENK